MIKWEQMVLEGTPQYGVALEPIDFAAVARACGAGGFTVDSPTQLPSVLRQAFDHPGPAIVEAVIDPNEPPMPGHITTKQAWRFAESLAKGERGGWEIFKTVAKDKIREVI
jgi:pyruvate dehydrogenase (quinone)